MAYVNMTTNIKRIANRIVLFLPWVVLVMAIMVMWGWIFDYRTLIQIMPTFVPMQFNTAFCFLLTATALILYQNGLSHYSKLISFLVICLATLTLIQYISGHNFYIDEAFIKHAITTKTSHPGRMAPNTALCFILQNLCLLIACRTNKRICCKYIVTSMITIVLVLSFTEIFGYLTNNANVYGFNHYTRMAIHTSLAFIFLSINSYFFFTKEFKFSINEQAIILPIHAFIFISIFFILIYVTLNSNMKQTYNASIRLNTHYLERLISKELKSTFESFSRFSKRLKRRIENKDHKKLLIEDIQDYRENIKGFEYIHIYEKISKKKAKAKELWAQYCAFSSFKKIQNLNIEVAISTNKHICLSGLSNNLNLILNINTLFSNIIDNAKHLNLNVYLNKKSYSLLKKPNESEYISKHIIPIKYFSNLEIMVEPNSNYTKNTSSIKNFYIVILFIGILFSLSLSFTIRLWILSKLRQKQLQDMVESSLEANKNMNEVIKSFPEAVLIVSTKGNIIFTNTQAIRLLNAKREKDVIGKSIETFVPEGVRKKHVNYRKSFQKEPYARNMGQQKNIRILTLDKNTVDVEIALTPILFKNEKCIMSTISNISFRKQYESKLLRNTANIELILDITSAVEKESSYKKALNICMDMIATTHQFTTAHCYQVAHLQKGNFLKSTNLWLNRSSTTINKLKLETKKFLLKKGHCLSGDSWSSRKATWTNESYNKSTYIRPGKNANSFNIKTAVSIPVFVNSQIYSVIELFSENNFSIEPDIQNTYNIISEQLSRIFERKLTAIALEEAEKKNRLILNFAGEGIFGVDLNNKVTFINPSALNILGYKKEDIINKDYTKLIHHYQLDREKNDVSECLISSTLKKGKEHQVSSEAFWNNKNESVPVDYVSRPITNSDGEIVGAVVTFSDITKRKLLEQIAEEQQEKLELANKELESFTYTVSHDLKAPLRHIQSFIQILGKKLSKKVDSEEQQLLSVVQSSSKKMFDLINDLLTFSHIGKNKIRLEEVDHDEFVNSIFSELISSMTSKKINLIIPKPLPVSKVDKNLFKIVWQNLLENAIKYSSINEVINITISYELADQNINFNVKDNGIGFDEKYAKKIFQVFERIQTDHDFEGTGIGLANVEKIVAKHGGKVWATGKNGQGATFSFSIPR